MTPIQSRKPIPPTSAARSSAGLVAAADGSVEMLAEITPAFAAELLARRHPNQRPLKEKWIAELAKAMGEGRWRWTSDTIKLDRELRVIDGQHRLAACVKSGVPMKNVLVATIAVDDVLLSIDQGRPRNLNDIRATQGHKGLPRVVSGAILAESSDWDSWRGMPRELQVRTINECEFVHELELLFRSMDRNSRAISSVGAMSGALRCIRANHDAAMQFFGGVFAMNPNIDGVEQPMVLALYSYLSESKKQSFSTETRVIEHAAKSIIAYNHWRAGRNVGKLVWKGGPPMDPAK